MKKKVLNYFVLFIQLLLLFGCAADDNDQTDIGGDSAPSQEVVDYVESFNLPELQEIKTMLDIPEEDMGVYYFEFGEAQDCPAGCHYAHGTILRHGEKIGWIDEEPQAGDPEVGPIYDLEADEDYLFTDEFYQKIADAFGWSEYGPFEELLAKDADTPHAILLEFAQSLAINRGQGYLAGCLLYNPAVQVESEILTIIAGLNESYSEYYDHIMAARAYLAALEP